MSQPAHTMRRLAQDIRRSHMEGKGVRSHSCKIREYKKDTIIIKG